MVNKYMITLITAGVSIHRECMLNSMLANKDFNMASD